MKGVYIVIPARNEAQKIGEVLSEIRKEGFNNIFVVDDGSTDSTAEVVEKSHAHVVRHIVNRGAGAATFTGIKAALEFNAEVIVTMDADGQHDPKDIPNLIKPILKKQSEVVLGSRLIQKKGMPLIRRIFNFIGNVVTWVLFGLWVSDSQSGFKAFSREAAEKIEIKTNGYEFCSELIRELKAKKLTYVEVPIQTKYTEYSMQKGQSFSNGVKTFTKLVLRSFMR